MKGAFSEMTKRSDRVLDRWRELIDRRGPEVGENGSVLARELAGDASSCSAYLEQTLGNEAAAKRERHTSTRKSPFNATH